MLNVLFVYPIIYVYTTFVIVVEVTEELSTHKAVWSVHEKIMTLFCSFSSIKKYISFVCRGVGMGKQVGSMEEESQVRGCYNITFICTPTNQETV